MNGAGWLARAGAAVLGAAVLLVSAVFTLGTSLAAPVGMWVLRKIARRRGATPSRGASWIGAAVASGVAFGILIGILVVVLPPQARRELGKAMTAQPSTEQAPPPPWLTRVFPQASRPNPAAQRLVQSRGFTGVVAVVSVPLMLGFFGAFAGSFGWAGALLLGYAFRRTRAAQPVNAAPDPAA